MPQRELRRTWCKTCNEFKLHSIEFETNENVCLTCDTVYTSISLKDIPEEKLLEQRKRYNEKKKQSFNKMYSSYLFPSSINLFAELFQNEEDIIHESDAGQIFLDNQRLEKEREERVELQRKREEEREEERRYRHLNRNDNCLCESGLKYKKCCWDRIQKIKR